MKCTSGYAGNSGPLTDRCRHSLPPAPVQGEAFMNDVAARQARGEKLRFCTGCGRWVPDEFWSSAARGGEAMLKGK